MGLSPAIGLVLGSKIGPSSILDSEVKDESAPDCILTYEMNDHAISDSGF